MSAVQILKEDPSSPDFKPLESALHAWEIRRSNPQESHRLARELVEHALEFDDPVVTAWAYLTCGAHEVAANDFEVAAETLDSASRLFERTAERRGESLTAILRGRMYTVQGKFQDALEVFKAVIEREGHGLRTLERFEAFNSISGCFWGMDKVDLSLMYLSKAFEVVKVGDFAMERATVLSNMGAALNHVGNYEEARRFLLAAREVLPPKGNPILSFNIHTNLIACCLELEQNDEAAESSRRMLTQHQDLAFAGPLNGSICNAALAFAKAKRWELSQQCMVGAAIIAQENPDPRNAIALRHAEAVIAEERGHIAVAVAHAEAILESSSGELSNEVRCQLYTLLIRCYQRLSQTSAVLQVKKKRLDLLDNRYKDGLAAAMIVLDVRAALPALCGS